MTGREHTVDVDRIVLTDLEVVPGRARCIRRLIEAELQRILEREGLPDGLTDREVHFPGPPMQLVEVHNEACLADGVALSIAHALRDAGSLETRE